MKKHLQTIVLLSALLFPLTTAELDVGEFSGKPEDEPPASIVGEEDVSVEELSVEERILKEFPEHPSMLEVARCESGVRQYDSNGNVIRGNDNPNDVGLFQINEDYWLEEAQKQGINIYTLEGNIEMAKVILSQQGISAWNWSKHCWLK